MGRFAVYLVKAVGTAWHVTVRYFSLAGKWVTQASTTVYNSSDEVLAVIGVAPKHLTQYVQYVAILVDLVQIGIGLFDYYKEDEETNEILMTLLLDKSAAVEELSRVHIDEMNYRNYLQHVLVDSYPEFTQRHGSSGIGMIMRVRFVSGWTYTDSEAQYLTPVYSEGMFIVFGDGSMIAAFTLNEAMEHVFNVNFIEGDWEILALDPRKMWLTSEDILEGLKLHFGYAVIGEPGYFYRSGGRVSGRSEYYMPYVFYMRRFQEGTDLSILLKGQEGILSAIDTSDLTINLPSVFRNVSRLW